MCRHRLIGRVDMWAIVTNRRCRALLMKLVSVGVGTFGTMSVNGRNKWMLLLYCRVAVAGGRNRPTVSDHRLIPKGRR